MPTNDEDLREKIQQLSLFKAAVNLHQQHRSDKSNLERFSRSWEDGVLALIKSHTDKEVLRAEERLLDETMVFGSEITEPTKNGNWTAWYPNGLWKWLNHRRVEKSEALNAIYIKDGSQINEERV